MAAASSWREETEIAGWWRAVACTRGRLSVVDTVYTKQPRVIWRPRISVESNLGCHNRNVLATLRCYCYCWLGGGGGVLLLLLHYEWCYLVPLQGDVYVRGSRTNQHHNQPTNQTDSQPTPPTKQPNKPNNDRTNQPTINGK